MSQLIPWRPIQAILWDSFQSFIHKFPASDLLFKFVNPTPRLLLPPSNGSAVPVYVMMPLDSALSNPKMSYTSIEQALYKLHQKGITGIMIDIWWGICEPQPEIYHFDSYLPIFSLCKQIGLKIQATISFHACGGNVGDTVNIPLPSWVHQASETYPFWFCDRSGNLGKEYISFGADHIPVLPCKNNIQNRTPLQAYGSFIEAFVKEMKNEAYMESTIVELQIGMGPCGELRYPSYPQTRWQFPGIGEFQCFDEYLLKDLKQNVQEKGSDFVKQNVMPPEHTGHYNDKIWGNKFFQKDAWQANGLFFMRWYSAKLIQHGEDVLEEARKVIPIEEKKIKLALKISGIHWWKFTRSRPAEATAGYMIRPGLTVYEEIAQLCKSYDVVLDFTCLEMRTVDQPFLKARCGPCQLVQEVFRHAYKSKVMIAGENALERLDWPAFVQIISAYKRTKARAYGFTLLRLGENMVQEENLQTIGRFVDQMNNIY